MNAYGVSPTSPTFGAGSAEVERGGIRIDLSHGAFANPGGNGLQDFSCCGIFNLAAGMADFQYVAHFQSGLAAHVDNQGIAAHVGHHALDLNFARGHIRGGRAQLAANVRYGLRYGFTQQSLAKVGSMCIKAANARATSAARANQRRA